MGLPIRRFNLSINPRFFKQGNGVGPQQWKHFQQLTTDFGAFYGLKWALLAPKMETSFRQDRLSRIDAPRPLRSAAAPSASPSASSTGMGLSTVAWFFWESAKIFVGSGGKRCFR